MTDDQTIVALATPNGVGAIGIIRLSGPEAITIANTVFKGKDLTKQASHTIHFGNIVDGDVVLDEVLASLFVTPRSYTGENVVEISCHGSAYIIESIIKLLIKKGARSAKAGEFTLKSVFEWKVRPFASRSGCRSDRIKFKSLTTGSVTATTRWFQ